MGRSVFLTISGCAMALVLPGVAGATHSISLQPAHDFAVGGAQQEFGTQGETKYSVAATSDPTGEDPRGHVRVESPLDVLSFDGRVDCLTVRGKQATVGTEREGGFPGVPGLRAFNVVSLTDGERAGPDTATFSLLGLAGNPPDRAYCDATAFVGAPVNKGNFTIHDALPQPLETLGTPDSSGADDPSELPEGARLLTPDRRRTRE